MAKELNNIRLNAGMTAGLYTKVLVEIEGDAGNPAPATHSVQTPKPTFFKGVEQAPEIKFLGNNARKVLILVNNTAHTFLPEGQLSFLTKILDACKLNIGDVAIVNINNYPDAEEIINSLYPSKIILFGVELIELNKDNIDIVTAPSINNLIGETAEAKALKFKLWNNLKQIFGV